MIIFIRGCLVAVVLSLSVGCVYIFRPKTISEARYIEAMSSVGCHHILDERSGGAHAIYAGLGIIYQDITDFRKANTAENMFRISHIIANRVAAGCP